MNHCVFVRDLPSSLLRVVVDPDDSLLIEHMSMISRRLEVISTRGKRTYVIVSRIGIATTRSFGRIVGFRRRCSPTLEHRVELGSDTFGSGSCGRFSAGKNHDRSALRLRTTVGSELTYPAASASCSAFFAASSASFAALFVTPPPVGSTLPF